MPNHATTKPLDLCKTKIDRMLARSQTKIIFPLITLGLLKSYLQGGKVVFSDKEVRLAYEQAVREMKLYLGHDLHVGGKYYDAYPSRNLPKYGVLKVLGPGSYELSQPYIAVAETLATWIPLRIKEYISSRLTIIPQLSSREFRVSVSQKRNEFMDLITTHIDSNPTTFEIFCFAIIKVHLEKFACKIYRDTRTAAHDRGVDLSTDFGVVYQIKKLKVSNEKTARELYAELESNFDRERIQDGKVVLVIDDIEKATKNFLINMKVQSISKADLLSLASQVEEVEDREKILRVISDEFRREYASNIQ